MLPTCIHMVILNLIIMKYMNRTNSIDNFGTWVTLRCPAFISIHGLMYSFTICQCYCTDYLCFSFWSIKWVIFAKYHAKARNYYRKYIFQETYSDNNCWWPFLSCYIKYVNMAFTSKLYTEHAINISKLD